MNIVSAVTNMQKELDWYKEITADMRGIIKQLSGQPPDGFEYIHPYDVAVMLEDLTLEEVVVRLRSGPPEPESGFINIKGKRYKQSPYVPASQRGISKFSVGR